MKYRRIALICLIFLLILSACAPAQRVVPATESNVPSEQTELVPVQTEEETIIATTEPLPVYDSTPIESQAAVTVDGTVRPAFSGQDELLYLRLFGAEQTQLTGETKDGGIAVCTVTGSYEGETLSLNNRDLTVQDGQTTRTLTASPIFDGQSWYIPLASFLKARGYSEYFDAEQNHLYYSRRPDVAAIPDGYAVPTLMYHAVSDDTWGIEELFVSPSELEKQLQYLNDNGYTTIFFDELPNIANIEKPVILTFDDGYDDNYTELFPLLKKYNCKATIFVIPGAIGTNHKMTAEQIKEMAACELVDIQSHTMTHRDLNELGEADTEYELSQSKLELIRLTGREPYVLCYPTGYNTSLTREIAEKYYDFGIIMNGGLYVTGCNRYLIPRNYVSRYTDIGTFSWLVN